MFFWAKITKIGFETIFLVLLFLVLKGFEGALYICVSFQAFF